MTRHSERSIFHTVAVGTGLAGMLLVVLGIAILYGYAPTAWVNHYTTDSIFTLGALLLMLSIGASIGARD